MVHPNDQYPNFFLTSNTSARPHPLHPANCWCHLWLQWGKGSAPALPCSFLFTNKGNIFTSHQSMILIRVCWAHLGGCQMTYHVYQKSHCPRTLKTMQTGHSVNQTRPTAARKWPSLPHIHDHLCTGSDHHRSNRMFSHSIKQRTQVCSHMLCSWPQCYSLWTSQKQDSPRVVASVPKILHHPIESRTCTNAAKTGQWNINWCQKIYHQQKCNHTICPTRPSLHKRHGAGHTNMEKQL